MGEIPEDVKTTAELIVDQLTFIPEHYNTIIMMISQAILMERQRCADTVMRMKSDTGQYVERGAAKSAILNP